TRPANPPPGRRRQRPCENRPRPRRRQEGPRHVANRERASRCLRRGLRNACWMEATLAEERALEHLRFGPAKGLALAAVQIVKDDDGGAEEHRVDLVEIASITLKYCGERGPVVGR